MSTADPHPERNDRAAAGDGAHTVDRRQPVIVRRARLTDARAIAEINVAGWRAAYRGLMPEDFLAGISIDARELAWAARLEGNESEAAPAWVAERDGRPVGYLVSGPPRDEDVEAADSEIYAVYVDPAEWRTGAGRALMAVALEEWRRRRAPEVVLWVLEGNRRARDFYESMGLRSDGAGKEFDMGGFTTLEVRYRIPLAPDPRPTPRGW